VLAIEGPGEIALHKTSICNPTIGFATVLQYRNTVNGAGDGIRTYDVLLDRVAVLPLNCFYYPFLLLKTSLQNNKDVLL
jgi:hypothetical protein